MSLAVASMICNAESTKKMQEKNKKMKKDKQVLRGNNVYVVSVCYLHKDIRKINKDNFFSFEVKTHRACHVRADSVYVL
jgi:mRNA-degrading endonuclease YafQ of YafQ-DinJ toxin-antitoxin module